MKPMHILSPFKAFRSLHKSSEQAYQEASLDEQAFNVDEDEDTMDIRQAGEGFDTGNACITGSMYLSLFRPARYCRRLYHSNSRNAASSVLVYYMNVFVEAFSRPDIDIGSCASCEPKRNNCDGDI